MAMSVLVTVAVTLTRTVAFHSSQQRRIILTDLTGSQFDLFIT